MYSKGNLIFPIDEGDKDTFFDWWYITSHFVTETGNKFSYTIAYTSEDSKNGHRQTSIVDETNKKFYSQTINGSLISKKRSLNLRYFNLNGDQDHWYQNKDKLFNYNLYTEINSLYSLDIKLSSNKPPLIHGGKGLIKMGNGGDSFYYSLTNLNLLGTYIHNGIKESITGIAWIDRQWGSWDNNGHDGWEWFALQLNDNTEIMLYLFFDCITGEIINPSLSIMFNDGSSIYLNEKDFNLKHINLWKVPFDKLIRFLLFPFSNCYFSSGWRLTIPKHKIYLNIIPIIKNQMVSIASWEGSCYIKGMHNDFNINTISTVELTHHYVYPRQMQFIKNIIRKFLRKNMSQLLFALGKRYK